MPNYTPTNFELRCLDEQGNDPAMTEQFQLDQEIEDQKALKKEQEYLPFEWVDEEDDFWF